MEFKKEKFKTLVHYVCYTSHHPQRLGMTKLNRILWASEASLYLTSGVSITGEKYVKQDFGPVALHLLEALDELKGVVEVRKTNVYDFEKFEFHSTFEPDLSLFTQTELTIIDRVRDEICNNHTAQSISQSIYNLAWESADDGEEIPHFTQLVSKLGEPDDDSVAWLHAELAKKEGVF